jgi:predicted nucleic-acid-binding protein
MMKPSTDTVKVTVHVPRALLEGTNMGTTDLIREALKHYRHRQACEALLAMKGKVKLGVNANQLKDLRD